ncbi:MAG: hypothetical protein ABIZ05_17305 [Pseudonocardiaceae bacterium]
MQLGEDGGFSASEMLGLADALFLGVIRGEFERHVSGGEPKPVDAGSAPISNDLGTAAWLPEAVPHAFSEVDDLWDWRIHSLKCG